MVMNFNVSNKCTLNGYYKKEYIFIIQLCKNYVNLEQLRPENQYNCHKDSPKKYFKKESCSLRNIGLRKKPLLKFAEFWIWKMLSRAKRSKFT